MSINVLHLLIFKIIFPPNLSGILLYVTNDPKSKKRDKMVLSVLRECICKEIMNGLFEIFIQLISRLAIEEEINLQSSYFSFSRQQIEKKYMTQASTKIYEIWISIRS